VSAVRFRLWAPNTENPESQDSGFFYACDLISRTSPPLPVLLLAIILMLGSVSFFRQVIADCRK
jgi:hypothetical protein